jgi:hypothetical protein
MSGVTLARILLPAAISVAGLLLLMVGDSVGRAAGIVLIGVAVLVVLANVLVRLGLQSERDREREPWNRRFFSRHGRWPEDRV